MLTLGLKCNPFRIRVENNLEVFGCKIEHTIFLPRTSEAFQDIDADIRVSFFNRPVYFDIMPTYFLKGEK